jgi:hypothetical protein
MLFQSEEIIKKTILWVTYLIQFDVYQIFLLNARGDQLISPQKPALLSPGSRKPLCAFLA